MRLQDYLHYYMGCKVITIDDNEQAELVGVSNDNAHLIHDGTGSYGTCDISGVKPLLRRLEDMTEGEMVNLLTDLFPFDMEDRPTADEFSMEMFYNDDGLMVDGDVSVGANYTCRCYEGQIAIKQCGTICFFDEAGNQEHGINVPKAYHYLLSNGFDLFGLIPSGLAIDAKTITP